MPLLDWLLNFFSFCPFQELSTDLFPLLWQQDFLLPVFGDPCHQIANSPLGSFLAYWLGSWYQWGLGVWGMTLVCVSCCEAQAPSLLPSSLAPSSTLARWSHGLGALAKAIQMLAKHKIMLHLCFLTFSLFFVTVCAIQVCFGDFCMSC